MRGSEGVRKLVCRLFAGGGKGGMVMREDRRGGEGRVGWRGGRGEGGRNVALNEGQ